MSVDDWHPPAYREYLRERSAVEDSLDQEFDRVEEAARTMRCSKSTVWRLIESGELRATRRGERDTLIPKMAIVDYRVPPRSFLDFFG